MTDDELVDALVRIFRRVQEPGLAATTGNDNIEPGRDSGDYESPIRLATYRVQRATKQKENTE